MWFGHRVDLSLSDRVGLLSDLSFVPSAYDRLFDPARGVVDGPGARSFFRVLGRLASSPVFSRSGPFGAERSRGEVPLLDQPELVLRLRGRSKERVSGPTEDQEYRFPRETRSGDEVRRPTSFPLYPSPVRVSPEEGL